MNARRVDAVDERDAERQTGTTDFSHHMFFSVVGPENRCPCKETNHTVEGAVTKVFPLVTSGQLAGWALK